MDVAGLMTDAVLMVEPHDRLHVAEALMLLAESRHIPVVENGILRGVISLRDLLAAQPPSTLATEAERQDRLHTLEAGEIMSRPPVIVHPHDSVTEAAEILLEQRISCLPVVDEGELVGILTSTDLARRCIEVLRWEAERGGVPAAVADLMTRGPLVIVRLRERLDVANLYMQYEKCRHLPVLDGERLVGIVSDRDLLGALRSRLEPLTPGERIAHASTIEVREIMTPDPLTTTPDCPAADAGCVLLEHTIGALPVLAGDRLSGILTVTDFLRHLVRSCARPAQVATAS